MAEPRISTQPIAEKRSYRKWIEAEAATKSVCAKHDKKDAFNGNGSF
jgi:hypothetical protein